jgi:hypothetical protein
MASQQPSLQGKAASMASRFTNSPVITRLRNSPVISAAKRWAAGKASPKPQPRDPNPRRASQSTATNTTTSNPITIAQNPPSNKIMKLARNAGPRARKMWEGFQEAIIGGYAAITNPKTREDYFTFLKSMGKILAVMYITFGALCVLYLPILMFLVTWAPGLIGQILTVIPLWAFMVTRKRHPMAGNKLFLNELERLSAPRARELEQQMNLNETFNHNWKDDLYHDLRTSWHFTRASLMWLACSIIPVVGSIISWIGQTWLVADRMGWNLLSVYTISAKKMSYRQQKHWMRARKWRILGFTLPYMLLASIPIVGPLFLGLAQAATAHVYYHLLSKDPESVQKQTASPLVEFKKPT